MEVEPKTKQALAAQNFFSCYFLCDSWKCLMKEHKKLETETVRVSLASHPVLGLPRKYKPQSDSCCRKWYLPS